MPATPKTKTLNQILYILIKTTKNHLCKSYFCHYQIVTGYDGNLYIISQYPGDPPCIESIGIEEGMLVPVQVADIVPSWTGAEIVAATIHGSLMLLSTQPDGEETKGEGQWVDATSGHKFAYRQYKV